MTTREVKQRVEESAWGVVLEDRQTTSDGSAPDRESDSTWRCVV